MGIWRWAREVGHPQAGGAPQLFDPADIAALKQLAAKCTPALPDEVKPDASIPPPPTVGRPVVRSTQLNVRVQSETRRRAQALAARRGTSLADVIPNKARDGNHCDSALYQPSLTLTHLVGPFPIGSPLTR